MKVVANSFVVMRNNVPCQTIDLNVPHLQRIKKICIPSPLPPQPRRFRTSSAAEKALERTETASRLLRESILSDYIRERFPLLCPLLAKACYEVKPYCPEALQAGHEVVAPKAYGCDVEVELNEGGAAVSTQQFHWRGTEAYCRRKAMLQKRAVRILKITPLDKETYIRAYGVNRRA